MMVLVAAGLMLLASGIPMWRADAQEPPASVTLDLTHHAPGGYRLEVRGAGAIAPYEVAALVSRIGSDQGVVVPIAWTDGEDELLIDLSLPLSGMSEIGCYVVRFFVRPADEAKPGPADGDTADAATQLDAYGCVDASGRTTFPGVDATFSPPPAPPSDVRIVDDGAGAYRIAWRDNSDDEIAFDPGILLFDKPWGEGGTALAGIDIPLVPANTNSAESVGFFFIPTEPIERRCGYALVLVFAVGADAVSPWPGNTTVPACFGRGYITLPATGSGPTASRRGIVPVLLALAGLALAGAGLFVRRRA